MGEVGAHKSADIADLLEANQRVERGDSAGAIALLKKKVDGNLICGGLRTLAHHTLGAAYAKLGELNKSVKHYHLALKGVPGQEDPEDLTTPATRVARWREFAEVLWRRNKDDWDRDRSVRIVRDLRPFCKHYLGEGTEEANEELKLIRGLKHRMRAEAANEPPPKRHHEVSNSAFDGGSRNDEDNELETVLALTENGYEASSSEGILPLTRSEMDSHSGSFFSEGPVYGELQRPIPDRSPNDSNAEIPSPQAEAEPERGDQPPQSMGGAEVDSWFA